MKTSIQINAKGLLRQAKASEHKEAYQPIAKAERYRVGIGARQPLPAQTPTFFVEIIVNVCPTCAKVDLGFFERALNVLKILGQKGYMLTCQDCNSILCEKLVSKTTLQGELEAAIGIVDKVLEKQA